ncbi:MAG: hypothetical protein H6868_10285 [Rhodospirillales bacterium]|nr:hypothetical protein [Rhodospirillales bacterium]
MKKQILIAGALLSSVVVGGCVDRATADAKLVKACKAGVEALLPEGEVIERVAGSEVKDSPTGAGHRHVTLTAIKDDGWLEEEVPYECVFEESFGFLSMNYTASVYQVRLSEDKIVGKVGSKIQGDPEEFVKLTDAIREALYE